MHDLAYTTPAAQHLPAGWNFPTMQPIGGAPAPTPAPVVGGGGSAATVTRVRWGRLLLVFAGILLLGFGAWNMGHAASSGTKRAGTKVVSGGGTGSSVNEVAIADADAAGTANLDSSGGILPAPKVAPTAAPATVPTPKVVHRRAAVHRIVRRHVTPRRIAAGGGAGFATRARTAHAAPAAARVVPRYVRGAGAGRPGAQGELPYTGLSTWIAAILGMLLLGIGICVQVNAVRIAATAILYRRGILLRPVDCARLAQERGFPRARVVVSDLLHRLLEEPAAPSDFVGTRLAR
jgi:hypothetical protein